MKIANSVFTNAPIKGTPFEAVTFAFVSVTPELAAEWLKTNRNNRKLKDTTVAACARDMKNGEWLTTHQGVAFNCESELIDGQHRLHAVIRSKTAVLMVVSHGWPKKLTGKKTATMDAVDMGCGRTLADQLELQHGIKNGGFVAKAAASLAKLICGGFRSSRKQSPSSVLATADIFRTEFAWLEQNFITHIGLRNASVNGVVILGLAVWPEKTKKFYEQLKTGLDLSATNPVYPLRQWLLLGHGNSKDEIDETRQATANHLKLYVEGKTAEKLDSKSTAALGELRKLNLARVRKVMDLFDLGDGKPGGTPTQAPVTKSAEDNSGLAPYSPGAIEIGKKIEGAFSMTDLEVRLDGGAKQASLFLTFWKQKGWIEPMGVGQYRKTAIFGRV